MENKIGETYTIYINKDTNEWESKDKLGRIQPQEPKLQYDEVQTFICDGNGFHVLTDEMIGKTRRERRR